MLLLFLPSSISFPEPPAKGGLPTTGDTRAGGVVAGEAIPGRLIVGTKSTTRSGAARPRVTARQAKTLESVNGVQTSTVLSGRSGPLRGPGRERLL